MDPWCNIDSPALQALKRKASDYTGIDELSNLWTTILIASLGEFPDHAKLKIITDNATSMENTQKILRVLGGNPSAVSETDWCRWWTGTQKSKTSFGTQVYPEPFWQSLRNEYRAEIIRQGEKSMRLICDSEAIILGLLSKPPLKVICVHRLSDVASGQICRKESNERFIINRTAVHWERVKI